MEFIYHTCTNISNPQLKWIAFTIAKYNGIATAVYYNPQLILINVLINIPRGAYWFCRS